MAIETCTDCFHTYDPDMVNIPTPIPDYMCAVCGTQMTEEEVANLPHPVDTNNS